MNSQQVELLLCSCTIVGGCFWGEVLVGKSLTRKKGGLDNSSLDLTLGAMSSLLVCVGQAVSICSVSALLS